MKLLVFSDPHNADKPPRSRHEGYREEILAKQEFLIEPAKDADLVVCTGDVFHSKKAEGVSYALMNKICEIYREFPKLLIVPGNHDIETRMDWSDRPLGILGKLPNIQIVHGDWFYSKEHNIGFICWGGGEFFPLYSMIEFLEKGTGRSGFQLIAVLHASIAEEGLIYPFDCLDVSQIMAYCDFALLGHLHDFQKTGVGFMATGALSRGVLSLDTNFDRPVVYGWLELKDEQVSYGFNNVPVKPADAVFKVEKKLLAVKQREQVDAFVEFIQNFDVPKSLNREDAIQYIRQLPNITENVKREAVRILEGL